MKTSKLFSTLAIVAFTVFQANAQLNDNGTNVGIGTAAPANGLGTTATNVRLHVDGATESGIKGANIAQQFKAGSIYSSTNSETTGYLGYNSNWAAGSSSFGVIGTSTVSTARAYSTTANVLGGRFIADLGATSGSNKFQIGGVYGHLKGAWNGASANGGFAAGVVGVDEINGAGTFGGYFKGRGYFSDKVGIGTENPTSELHVHNGTIRLTGTSFAGGPMILFGENGQTTDNGQWGIEYIPAANGTPGLNFWRPWPNSNFGNHFLFLSDTGKVAVGTDNTPTSIGGANISAYRFFVKGGMLAEEVRVRTGWADYVFADDYNLKPLAEVEAFIKENKHLPNVPSANTVESQGIELGDMSRIQQEKIEELTLYIIDQQKQIDELKSLVYELKDKE